MENPLAWGTPLDKLAMAAMQGLCAGLNWTPGKLVHEGEIAEDAYAIAGAMLRERDEVYEQ